MKVINKAQLKKAEWAMIENEIDVLEKVSRKHPNVIHLYAHFTVANECGSSTPFGPLLCLLTPERLLVYLIMDLCTGGELFDLIYELGSFYEDDAQRIIYTLLDAVAHLHENNVVHRDLKVCLRRGITGAGE